MGSITYKPAPGEAQTTSFRGIRLEAGKAVEIKDPSMLAKLEGHPQFDVSIDDKEREQAQQASAARANASSSVTNVAPAHPSYYATGGGAAATDDQEALGGAVQVTPLPPSPANAAGGGLNGPTVGDVFTPEQVEAHYGAANPLESLQPGEPASVQEVTSEVQQAQAEKAQQAEAPARPRGRPRHSAE